MGLLILVAVLVAVLGWTLRDALFTGWRRARLRARPFPRTEHAALDLRTVVLEREIPVAAGLLLEVGHHALDPHFAEFDLQQVLWNCIDQATQRNIGSLDLFVGGRSVPYQYGIAADSYLYINDGKGNFKKALKNLPKI